MRLSVEDLHGDDFEKADLVLNAEVLLDGQRVERCLMADEEKGEVLVYIPQDDPRWKTEVKDSEEWPTETKHGKVEIIDRRKVGVLHA